MKNKTTHHSIFIAAKLGYDIMIYMLKRIFPIFLILFISYSVLYMLFPNYVHAIQNNTSPSVFKIPLLGSIDSKSASLPLLTIIIALFDGFNPCAMWILVFLLSLLIGMSNRKRILILGAVFILTSGIVYFLILSAWLNLLLFLGFFLWIRLLVGTIAIGFGIYCLYEVFANPKASCKVTADPSRQKTMHKLKGLANNKNMILALIGIIFLAFAVNIIEGICSAGLPAVFTQVLTLNNLPMWQYYAYILLYVFIFMLDDLIVFTAAAITLKAISINERYARYANIIGGIVMVIIGLLLLFKPELLSF